MGKSAKASADKQTTSGGQSGNTGPDAQTQARINEIYGAGQNAANAGVPGAVAGAQGFYNGAIGYGNQGNAALGGDANALASYMNPYQQQVLDKMNQQFAQQNTQTANQMNDAATRAGAFGGSRHGVATGVALAQNQMNQGAQMAGLLSGGYTDAMGRAAQQAQMGYNAAGAGANLGMTAGSPDLWKANILKQTFTGLPYGQTYDSRNNQATTKTGFASSSSSNPFAIPGLG